MAEYLLDKTDNEVVVATRRTSHDNLVNLNDVMGHPRLSIRTVDLADANSITALVRDEKPDYLLNLAGSTFVPDSFNSPAQVLQVNAVSLVYILEAVRQFAPYCRVFSAGSSTEADCKSVYAVSKIAAGALCRVYREKYGLYIVHGVMANHASPRQSEVFLPRKVAKGVARIARAFKKGEAFEPIELGNLDAQIDISASEDFVDGIWRMINQPCLPTGKLNSMSEDQFVQSCLRYRMWMPKDYSLASGELHTVRELVEKAFAAAGVWGQWNGDDVNETYGTDYILDGGVYPGSGVWKTLVKINPIFYRPLDTPAKAGDSSAIQRELGWSPKITFSQLIERMVKVELESC